MALKDILAAQLRWADRHRFERKGIQLLNLGDNLIMPMVEQVREQFHGGAGGEMGTQAVPGKMYSLRSSSALAYNFFAPWVDQDLQPLASALGQKIDGPPVSFERPFNHGLPPYNGRPQIPPNLDIAIGDRTPLAIECKFTEPYAGDKSGALLKDAYFDGGAKRWATVGLPECQRLAESLGKDLKFRRLDAAQLLKHFLGLAHTTQVGPRLLCLWYDSGCEQAEVHRDELQQFAGMIDGRVQFSSLTYQEAFTALRRGPEPRSGYFEYLGERYFDPHS